MTTVSEVSTEPTEELNEDFASMFESHSKPSERLQPGQKVTATIIAISGENIFLDVGIKVDGVMERKDILDPQGEPTVGMGDSIEAWVIAVSPQEIRLSRSMSGSGVAALEDARDSAIPVDGKVTALCKGGYTVDVLGKRAFCPGSQMDAIAMSDPEVVVGRTMQFLITRVESRGRNIVVSHRALMERERKASLETLLENIKEGDVIEGSVTRLAPFGAFVELAPAVEGMIHISELGWARISTPEEAVAPGDIVRAKVLSITQDAKGATKISLSRKQAEMNPWENVQEKLEVGAVVAGRVVRLTPFGAFVEVLPGIDGLVHVSEMSWAKRVYKPEDVVTVGTTVQVKIKEIILDSHRISLSMRDAEGDPWGQVATQFSVGSTVTGTVESRAAFGFFVNLAPGITGLLPLANLKNAAPALQKLQAGESVTLMIQSIDVAQRRISLAPEGTETKEEDTSWKKHTRSAPKADTKAMGTLGMALSAAMQRKK